MAAFRPLRDPESHWCRWPRADHALAALVALNVTSSSRCMPGGAP
jgi:hypothetical protein